MLERTTIVLVLVQLVVVVQPVVCVVEPNVGRSLSLVPLALGCSVSVVALQWDGQ